MPSSIRLFALYCKNEVIVRLANSTGLNMPYGMLHYTRSILNNTYSQLNIITCESVMQYTLMTNNYITSLGYT